MSKKNKVKNISFGSSVSKYSSKSKEKSTLAAINPQRSYKGPYFRRRGTQSAQALTSDASNVSPVFQQGTAKQSETSRSTTIKRLVKVRLSNHKWS